MSFYTVKMYTAECDECRCIYDLDLGDVNNKNEALKKFRELGWLIGKKTICPECIHKRKHPEEYNYGED